MIDTDNPDWRKLITLQAQAENEVHRAICELMCALEKIKTMSETFPRFDTLLDRCDDGIDYLKRLQADLYKAGDASELRP